MIRLSEIKKLARTAGYVLSAFAALACTAPPANAAAPGITGTSFHLVASAGYTTQPDGAQIYTWGYGCAAGTAPTYAPAAFQSVGFCPTMQLPGPTLIVTEGQAVTVTLTNNLPNGAGSTSIIFAGIPTTASGGVAGMLGQEAPPGGTITYTLNTTGKAGTHAYYSGTQPDLQIEMGMYGALIVLPATPPATCTALGKGLGGGEEYRHAPSAYDHAATCYDREYLFQFGEIDPSIHQQVEAQIKGFAACPPGAASPITGARCPPANLSVVTEPYHPRYFTINGRSMPDDMDSDYAPNYPNQPYNGNPHMHPLDQVLLRIIGQGRWEHPFHEHANHVRVLARDGNLMLSPTDPTKLAGLMMFTTDTIPGQTLDGIFYFSGKGLNWDMYGHTPTNPASTAACVPDANGFYTAASGAVPPVFASSPPYAMTNPTTASLNYGEWCADHNHPLEANPVGQVGGGGMATTPDPLVVSNGGWYNGSPYLGPDAVARSRGQTPLPPGKASQNPLEESGMAYMWHSHNEREITTNDVFPGGMLMMMLVDPPVWYIDEKL